MEEKDIIENLKKSGPEHDAALSYLFTQPQYRDPIHFFLRSRGLSTDDCSLLWTDIVIKFSLLVRNGKYQHQGKMLGYIKNLSGYMCLNHLRDLKKERTGELFDGMIKDEAVESVTLQHKELKKLFNEQLSKLGASCKSILSLWALSYSMKEIQEKLDFVSVEATRKRKHICLQKLLEHIAEDKALLNLFEDYYYDN